MRFRFLINRKRIIIGIILLLILGTIFFFIRRSSKPPVYQFAAVKIQNLTANVSGSGSLTGKETADLRFKSSGKLGYLNVKAGDVVTKGEVIAGLDTQDLNITLQQAQNSLRDKQAIVDQVLDNVKDHSSDETFTQKQERTTAQVARDNAFDNVKAAQRAFQDAVIVSPIDGLVTQAKPVAGQVVTSDIIAEIVDTSEIYFDTDVDEADIGKVKVGQQAEVTLDSYPNQVFKGLVSKVLPTTKTTSSGATVVTVRIILTQHDLTFVNGLSGQGSIIYASVNHVLTVPQEALREDNTIVMQQGKILVAKKVEVGISSDTDIEIKSGLSEGEKVVLNPPAVGAKLN